MRTPMPTVVMACLATACGGRPQLSPAPEAQPAPPGREVGAMAVVDGVRVIARPEAWSGVPRRLEEVTPVLVTVENEGATPVRLRYERFAVIGPRGERYAAIPPFDIRGTEVEALDEYDLNGFYVAPHLRGYYPWLEPYGGRFPRGLGYYDTYYPRFLRIRLPTGDMVQKALPEGVLAPGGRISGFLYFENVDDDLPRVELAMELIDAATGADLGVARIPFVVR